MLANVTPPILFIIFNRPKQTQIVFNSIREAKPSQLFIAADGPRTNNKNDAINCPLCREIVSQVDWNCDVQYLFRDANLGCKIAVTEAITWFFSIVEMGIILEDDCLPDSSFYSFCSELLVHYKDDERIMHISGNNFQFGTKRGNESYYFSRFPHIWGWASWKRAWNKYDINMSCYPALLKNNDFIKYADNFILKLTYEGKVNTWDSQWLCTVNYHKGYSILPQFNLVKNIGMADGEATNTNAVPSWYKKLTYSSIGPLLHPTEIVYNNKADYFTKRNILSSFRSRTKNKIRAILSLIGIRKRTVT